MKKLIVTFILAVLGGGLASPAQAWYPGCPAYTVSYQPCVVTTYRPEWREEKVNVTVDHWTSRIVVDKVNVKSWVPRWEDEKQVHVSYRYDPKVVQQDVVRCNWIAVCFLDPCTGCPYTTWQPKTYVERINVTVHEAVPVQTVVPVKVCRWALQDQVVDCQRVVWDNNPQQVVSVRRYCVMVPHQTTVAVPVCTPCYNYFACWGW